MAYPYKCEACSGNGSVYSVTGSMQRLKCNECSGTGFDLLLMGIDLERVRAALGLTEE